MQVEIKQHSPFGDKLKIRRRAFLPCLKARGFQPEDFDDNIGNNEILYRRVNKHKPNVHPNDRRYRQNELGNLEVLPMAFYDKKNEPSVDRACMHNNRACLVHTNNDLSVVDCPS